MSGGSIVRVCPHCGSNAIRLFQDNSGVCMRCGKAFMESAAADAVATCASKATGDQTQHPSGGGEAATLDQSAPSWRRDFAASRGQARGAVAVGGTPGYEWATVVTA